MYNKLKITWKEASLASFEALFLHLNIGTEKTDIKGRAPWPGFESSTPVTQVESVAVVAKLYVMMTGA